MAADRNKILSDSIKRLLRRDASMHLRKIVNKAHAADLSVVFRGLSVVQQRRVFDLIKSPGQKGLLLSEIDDDLFQDLITDRPLDEIVEIFETMPTDDVADLIGELTPELSDAILERMKNEGSEQVEGLLRYGDDTAGGIMVPDFIALPQDVTSADAIASLQKEYQNVEMPFYLYVVDEYGHLVGVVSLRQLVVVTPDTPLKQFMTTDVFYVTTDMDQEEVARIVARYDILAVPVVDLNNILVGIVTVDDIIDIIRQEATEDIFKMAGVGGEEFVETKSIGRSTKIRLPWLFASCIGGLVAFLIIGRFETALAKVAYLAAFIPVILGMGGNVGTQSSTIVVRGLATGRLNVRDIWTVVSKEIAVGLILGITYGVLIGTVAQLRYPGVMLAVSVGLAVVCSMTLATLVGSMVPMLFARMGVDPAVATGPFVTTSIDIIAVALYFLIVTSFLGV
ncbi:MAG: magnesium transporter [Desulfobacteraceae bacterium]|nr:magnesium transporter [Desulfobacteraceae bacterium]